MSAIVALIVGLGVGFTCGFLVTLAIMVAHIKSRW